VKKIGLVFLFLFIATIIFGQDFTFQGLPWGASREQVIEKLGRPDVLTPVRANINDADIFSYTASILGYQSWLEIIFVNNYMSVATYNVGRFQRLNNNQLQAAYTLILGSLIERYGAYHEIIAYSPVVRNNEEHFVVWHFNNFHIVMNTIVDSSESLFLSYSSTVAWNQFEEDTVKEENMIRFPNRGL